MSNLYQITRRDILVLQLVTWVIAVVRTSNILRKSSSSVSQDILCCYYSWQPVTMFTAACHWTIFWTNTYALLLQDQLSFNKLQGVDSGLFPFSTRTLYTVILRVLRVQHITSSLTYDLNNIRRRVQFVKLFAHLYLFWDYCSCKEGFTDIHTMVPPFRIMRILRIQVWGPVGTLVK